CAGARVRAPAVRYRLIGL
ncbi:hypothetical protein BMAJHU_E0499, partial [Burkholderia mallei JHU]